MLLQHFIALGYCGILYTNQRRITILWQLNNHITYNQIRFQSFYDTQEQSHVQMFSLSTISSTLYLPTFKSRPQGRQVLIDIENEHFVNPSLIQEGTSETGQNELAGMINPGARSAVVSLPMLSLP